MKKNKLVKRFVIGTFVSLYVLVSTISTIHSIDFFEMSNPTWMAVTLAIGFELGAAASLAAIITLEKMNKTLVWALFIIITAMQIQGNMFFAFKHINNFSDWSELFNLIEEDLLYQKRIIAVVSGAILPLVALGFIKSLVDYIKPDGDIKEKVFNHPNWNGIDEHWDGDDELFPNPTDEQLKNAEEALDAWREDYTDEYTSDMHYEFQEDALKYQDINPIQDKAEEWDEDHALDQVLNDAATELESEDSDLEPWDVTLADGLDNLENDFDAVGEELDAKNFTEPNFTEDDDIEVDPPNDALMAASGEYKDITKPKEPVKNVETSYEFGKNLYNTVMSKINTDHLPKPSVEETTKAYNNLGLVNKKSN